MVQITERVFKRDGSLSKESVYFSEDGLNRLVMPMMCLGVEVVESSANRVVLRSRIMEFIFEGDDLSPLQAVAQWYFTARNQEALIP